MKTTFDDFTQDKPKYNKEYFLSNMPDYLEFGELWLSAVNMATKNGKKSTTFASVMAIYNSLEKKQTTPKEPNTKYIYYKTRFDQIAWKDQSRKKFYKSLLDQLKTKGDLSQNQWNFLQRLK